MVGKIILTLKYIFTIEKPMLSHKGLVNIKKVNPKIRLDLRYATKKNIAKRKLYSKPLCFFKKEVAEKLSLIQKELKKDGLTLIIWDGYRPFRIQKLLWQAFPNPKYNTKVSSHNKGIAVDLTLGDKKGKPVSMPTDFDVFEEKAHHDYKNLSARCIKNREKLKRIMRKYGFESFKFEWWHYTYSKLKNSPVINIPI